MMRDIKDAWDSLDGKHLVLAILAGITAALWVWVL